MGYRLEGLVTSTAAAETQPLPHILLRQGFSLIPLPHDVHEQATGDGMLQMTDVFMSLSRKIHDLAVSISYKAPVAYLEAELFAASGTQAAVVWHDGAVVLGPIIHDTESGGLWAGQGQRCSWPFNTALRMLGVQSEDDNDEFDTVDLGRCRRTEDWISSIPRLPSSS